METNWKIRTVWVIAATTLSAFGCAAGEMGPGEQCGNCHREGLATPFGVAGTIYASARVAETTGRPDTTIRVTDRDGRVASMTSNAVGNFYTTQPLTPPLQVTVWRSGGVAVTRMVVSGDCNGCHRSDASPGRLTVP